MPRFQKQLWLARGILILGLVLIAAAWFFPLNVSGVLPVDFPFAHQPGIHRLPFIAEGYLDNAEDAWRFRHFPDYLRLPAIFAGVLLLLPTLPLLAGFLARARPLLWIVRAIVIAAAALGMEKLAAYYGYRTGPGTHLLILGCALFAAGLLLIPHPAPPDRHRFLWLNRVILILSFLGLFTPLIWRLNHQDKHWIGSYLEDNCSQDLYALESIINQFEQRAGRPPTTEEGWSALLSHPAGLRHLRAGERSLLKIPIDPWGQPYRYESGLCHNVSPQMDQRPIYWGVRITSGGPDRIIGFRGDRIRVINFDDWTPKTGLSVSSKPPRPIPAIVFQLRRSEMR